MEKEETMTKKKSIKLLIIGVIVLLIAAGGYYFWKKGATYESTDNAQLDGDILPVRAEITAKIDRIYFTDNQLIKKGDTLLAFDTTELKTRILQAAAALENAKANLEISGSRAIASGENANASSQNSAAYQQDMLAAKTSFRKAQKDFDRASALLQAKAITQQQFEDAQANLSITKVEYQKAVNQQQSSVASSSGLKTQAKAEESQIMAAKATVKQRAAELLQIQQQLAHAYIIAPFDGIVTKRTAQQGQYVTAGAPLCTVINQTKLWVTANFKETQLNKIKIGQQVLIKLDAYPDLKLNGTVASFGGATGAKFSLIPPDNASGNFIKITQRFPIRIVLFSLPKDKPTVLFAGLSAFVKVRVTE
ncbi:HlyD family secretion protein [Pedobacter sp. MC2016-24]|uniref:HlyD family secretion protein n=1 Tax=Pedobacter sp. MC2016-24 TaxID=2780090 RepID=UPI0018814A9E|nr:HlyD family secretion protein [Pedobacter sp. MC2016-24]MBE9602205.1 HlyD family secretion protein [Pedobacter sp. MC2016-24]